jgi:hypothetical protein
VSQDLWILILGPPIMTLVFLALSWSYGRAIRGRRPFTPFMRVATVYGALFLLGMYYVISVGSYLHWPTPWMVAGSTIWGLLVVYVAWRRHKRGSLRVRGSSRPVRATLQGGLPTLGLLICLVAGAIE